MKPVKLYIHVPFCRSKCAYCDFYSSPRLELIDGYVDAVAREWEDLGRGLAPVTTYLGGGTPSSLPLSALDRLLSIFPITEGCLREFTIEANPDDITPDWAKHIAENTLIDRVSMGIQTFDDATLRLIGRRHSARQAVEAIDTLRRVGINNLSCDLIYGLPGQTLDEWRRSLDTLISLRPAHISAYLLSYEPRTRLGVMLRKGQVSEAPETLVEEMYAYLCEAARRAGYRHYEISNFGLPGHEAIHNSGYWDGSDYLGLGPGAHSMVDGVRWSNPGNLTAYIRTAVRGFRETDGHEFRETDKHGLCKTGEPGSCEKSEHDFCESGEHDSCETVENGFCKTDGQCFRETGARGFREIEEEDNANRFNDLLITALRTSRGLDPADVPPQFADSFARDAERLIARGDLTVTPAGHLAIPESRWLLSNPILFELIQA